MAALTGDIYQMLKDKASETRTAKAATNALSQINKTTAQQNETTKREQVDSILGGNEKKTEVSPAQSSQGRLVDRGQNVAVSDTGTDDTIDNVMNNLLAQQKLWLGDNYQWTTEEANTLKTILSTSSDPEDTASRYIAAKGYALNFGISTSEAYNNLDLISEYYTGTTYDAKNVNLAQRIKNGFVRNDIMSLEYEWMQADLAGNTERANELEAQITEKQAYIGDNTSAIPVSRLDEIKSSILENFGYIVQPSAEGGIASAAVTAAGIAAAAAFPIASAAILGTTKTLSAAAATIFSGKQMYEWAAGEKYYSLMHDEEYQGTKNKGQAQLLSTIEGLGTAAIEMLLDGVSSKAVGAISGNKISKIGINAIVDLKKRGVTNTVANAVMDWATGAVDEGVFNELPEYILGEITSSIYKNANGIVDEKTWSDRVSEAKESIIDGIIVGAVYGAVALPASIKSDRKTALTLRRAANASTSLSEFMDTTKDMKPETMSDEDFETARTKVYEASQTQKKGWREETFKDTVLESEEISGQELFSTVNPETGEETAKALPDGKVYRTGEGELYSQTRTNNSQGTTEVFYGDPDSSALYGVVVLSSDGDTQTVQQVRVREGYEGIRSEMVKNALRDTLSTETNVEWNPTTKGLQNVKNELISNNPDKTGLVYKSTVRGNDADIQSLKTQIKTANPNLSEAEATLAARLTSIADVGTKTIKYESTSKLTTEQTGGKSTADFRGATDAARTLIYVGQNSDTSTFVHELFHAVSLVRTKEAQNLSTSIHNALQNEAEANQLKTFISEHSQIWGKDADVDKIMSSLLSIGENTSADKWTVSQHENLARLHEAYRSSSRSIQASLPKAIRAILEKLTQFMNKVYNTLKDNVALNEDIAKAYDSLMGVSEAAEQVESKGAEAEFKAYGEKGVGSSGILYQGSDAFKEWFNNSVVKDEEGNPIVVYHGTDNADFYEFDGSKIKNGAQGHGFYFTTNKEIADSYGDRVLDTYLSLQNPVPYKSEIKNSKNKVNAVIKNLEGRGYKFYKEVSDFVGSASEQTEARSALDGLTDLRSYIDADEIDSQKFYNDLREAEIEVYGIDGYIGDSGTYVAFLSSQVKSATQNNGQYDRNNGNILFQDSLIDDLSDLNNINPEDTDAINEKIQQIVNEDTESEKQAAIEADYLKSHNFNDEVFDSELPEGWEDNFESDYEDRLEREKELEDCLTNFPTTEAKIRWEQETPAQEGAVDHSTVQGANNLDITYREFVTINDPQIDYVTDADTDAKKDTVFRDAIKDDTVLRRYLGIIGGAYLYDTRYTNRGYEMERDSYGRMQEVHYTQPYKYDDAYRQMLYTRLQTQLSDRKLNNAFAAALTDAPLSEAQLKAIRKELGDNARFYRNILALLTQDGAMLPKELVKEVKGLDLPAREEMDRMGITGLAELARKAGDEELRQKILSGRLKFGNDKDQQIYKQLTEYIKRADKEIKEQEKEISALDTKSKNFDEQKAQLEKAIDERTEIILDAEEVVNALTDTLITDENNSGKKYRTELAEKFSDLRAKYNDLSPAREREHQKAETARQLDHAVKDGSRMREKKTAGHAGWRQQERGARYGTEAWVKEVTGLYPDLKELVDAEAAKDKRKSYEAVAKTVIENYRTDLKKQLDDLRVQMTGSAAKALSLNASKITRNLESIKALTDGTGVVILKDYLEDMQTQTKELTKQLADAEKAANDLSDKVYDAVTLERWKAAKEKHEAELKQAQKDADTKYLHKKEVADKVYDAVTLERWKAAKEKHEAELKQIRKDINDAYIVKRKFEKQREQHENNIKKIKRQQREKEKQLRQYKAIRDEKQKIANAIVRPVSLNTIDYSVARQIQAIQALVDPEFRKEWIYDITIDPTQQKTNIATMTIDQAKAYLKGLSADKRQVFYSAMPEDLMLRLTEARRPLNDYTIAELEDIAKAVDELRDEGRAILQAKKDARNRLAKAIKRDILTTLGASAEDAEADTLPSSLNRVKEKQTLSSRWHGMIYRTRRMQELAQLLDGGYGNKGTAYRLLVEEKRFHQNNEQKQIEKRYSSVESYATDEAINGMVDRVEIDLGGGVKAMFTVDQLAYAWLSQYDELNKAAVMYGSLLSEAEKGTKEPKGVDVNALTGKKQITTEWLIERPELIEDDAELEKVANGRYTALLEKAKQELTDRNLWDFVNAISADFNNDDNSKRLDAASIEYFNVPLAKRENYLPIKRQSLNGENIENLSSDQVLNPVIGQFTNDPYKGFLVERININPRNQTPVDMSLMGIWQKSVQDQEHFIEFSGYVKKLRAVFQSRKSKEVERAITKRRGHALVDEVNRYIELVANPDAENGKQDTINDVIRTIRGKTGAAYLGWKASGVILQAITSPASAFSELKPWEVIAAYGSIGAHPIESIKTINEKSIFMKNRTMNPIIDEAVQRRNEWTKNGLQKKVEKFEEVGQIGLTLVDRYAVAGPWLAMYKRTLNEHLKNGVDTSTAENLAIKRADEFIMQTQPVGDSTEIASMFRSKNEVVKTLLQFQTSLNVVYNNLTASTLGYIRNHQIARLVGTVIGYGVSGILLGLIQDGIDDDDEPKDIAKKLPYWFLSQGMGALPIFGSTADSLSKYLITGEYDWYMNKGVTMSPIVDKSLQAITAFGGGKPLKALGKFGEAAGIATGLPVSGFKEALEVVQQKSLAPLVGRE